MRIGQRYTASPPGESRRPRWREIHVRSKAALNAVFGSVLILQRRQHPVGKLLPAGQIDHLGRLIVKGIGKKEDFKQGRIRIGVHATFRKVYVRKGFDVDCQ